MFMNKLKFCLCFNVTRTPFCFRYFQFVSVFQSLAVVQAKEMEFF